MRPNIYDTRNEAGFDSPKFSVYYGGKEIDQDTEEWAFVIKKNGKEVFRVPNSELLQCANGESPTDMLIAGLALYLCK
jgi:hypothetical protein